MLLRRRSGFAADGMRHGPIPFAGVLGGEPVEATDDVWTLGVMLYQAEVEVLGVQISRVRPSPRWLLAFALQFRERHCDAGGWPDRKDDAQAGNHLCEPRRLHPTQVYIEELSNAYAARL